MRNDVQEVLKKYEVKTFGNKKQMKNVQERLKDDETVLYIAPTSAIIKEGRKKSKLPGIFVFTTKRFFFYYKVLLEELFDSVTLDKVQSINCSGNSMTGGHIEICTLVKSYDFLVTYKKPLMFAMKESFDEAIANVNTPAPAVAAVSAADELIKFKSLLDSGVITQEEFDAKKKQLLA